MKKRVLSGIQPSGKLHIGNYFGMIKRMVEYQESSDLFCFIANLHSLTTVQNKDELKSLTLNAAMDLLALGIDSERSHFWVQSDVPEVSELAWILSCLTPMGLMERAHSYKDKLAKGIPANLGLFSYPALMSADILINQSELVPVGKDQKQHLEMARDIAIKFNNQYGDVFTIPEPDILDDVAVIPGTDGQKMSKSYNNTIPIFSEPSEIKKAVMGIVTDSKGVDEPKDPEADNVFALYKLFASPQEQVEMSAAYKQGGLGYGDAKKALLEKITSAFAPHQEKRKEFESNPKKVEEILAHGAEKVRKTSLDTLEKVRLATGLRY
ncbi:MAG: tryptophan--tRNA ligase [Candidatus Peregrinibacteria bacterium]|nr:tryptophan--tRNA ligase [Candidatus Peregrinibacteria bacterium]